MKELAQILDEKAKGLAIDLLKTEALLLTVLMEMQKKNFFALLNYSNIFDYCERRLKLSRSQAYYFKSVAEKSEEVPEIKEAIVQGELTLSQARRILPAIDKNNCKQWIDKAQNLSQINLEKEVKAVNPRAHIKERVRPVAKELSELNVTLDPKAEENLEALKEILSQKLRKPASLTEVIAWALETTREKHDPIRQTKRARKISSRKSTKANGREPILKSVKHPVMVRDQMQCTYTSEDGRRCNQRRWLHLHHLQEVSQGGQNAVENLTTLCSSHHRMLHLAKQQKL